ncbi:MAG: hypothetical protein ACJAZV_000516 [Roseivirga sp.]|jgi:hypothetical protein
MLNSMNSENDFTLPSNVSLINSFNALNPENEEPHHTYNRLVPMLAQY